MSTVQSRPVRVRRSLHLAGLAFLALATSGAGWAQAPAPDPRQGDGGVSAFYTWEKAIPAVPGTLLRKEPLPAELGIGEAAEQYRILYSSTDGVGGKDPVAVSGTLFIPRGKPPKGGWPLLAWTHGTTGMADTSAPSWDGFFDSYREHLTGWLKAGFAIVATDYQGLGVPGPHPYLNTRPEAYSTLDSARVALRMDKRIANQVIAAGHSQGGAASFATGGYAAQYAPDINYLGTISTGVGYTSGKTVSATNDYDQDKVDPTIAYMLMMTLMAQQTHPDLKGSDILTPRALPLLDTIGTLRGNDLYMGVMDAGLTWTNTFQPGALPRLIGMTLDLMKYPTLKLEQPAFVGMGGKDTIALPSNQQLLATDACEAGTIVVARLYPDADHEAVTRSAFGDVLAFAKSLLAKEKIAPACQALPK